MKWISIKDKLPNKDELVYVVRFSDGKILPAIYEDHYGKNAFVWDNWGKSCDCCEEYYMSQTNIKDAVYWMLRSDILEGIVIGNAIEMKS